MAGEGNLVCAVSHELMMMSSRGGMVMEHSCDTPGTFVMGLRGYGDAVLLTSSVSVYSSVTHNLILLRFAVMYHSITMS